MIEKQPINLPTLPTGQAGGQAGGLTTKQNYLMLKILFL